MSWLTQYIEDGKKNQEAREKYKKEDNENLKKKPQVKLKDIYPQYEPSTHN